MDVVNYSEAARRAGVSRAMITKLKNAHIMKKSEKSYFVFNPKNGSEGINVDDKTWIKYVNKSNKQRSNQIKSKPTTVSKPTVNENSNLVDRVTMMQDVIDAAKEVFRPNRSDLERFAMVIVRKYEGR